MIMMGHHTLVQILYRKCCFFLFVFCFVLFFVFVFFAFYIFSLISAEYEERFFSFAVVYLQFPQREVAMYKIIVGKFISEKSTSKN